MYGFKKVTGKKNSDRGAYFHELFLRGRPGLSRSIMRKTCKNPLIDPSNEPNLNMYPPMPHAIFDPLHMVNQQEVNNNDQKSLSSSYNRTVQCGICPESSGIFKAIPDIQNIGVGTFDGDTNHLSSASFPAFVHERKQFNPVSVPPLQVLEHNQNEYR